MWSDFPRNLCTSARIGGQVLTLEGQTCSLGRTFTTITGEVIYAFMVDNLFDKRATAK